MQKQFSEDELLHQPLTPAQLREIDALSQRPDDDIDTSDIPEVREIPPGAIRGRRDRGALVRLNENLRRQFADLARRKGVPLDDLVNETLAKALEFADTVR